MSPTKTIAEEFFPPRTQPTQAQIDAVSKFALSPQHHGLSLKTSPKKNMTAVLALQTTARAEHAKRPFAALLVAPDHTTVLLAHQSVSHVDHAESSLARLAAHHYSQAYLWRCTLYSTWEPCAMCAATCYWANVGRVVFGASNVALLKCEFDSSSLSFFSFRSSFSFCF